jgi:hypothetical protein
MYNKKKEIAIWGVIDIETGQYVKFGTGEHIKLFATQEVIDTEDFEDHEEIISDFIVFGFVVDYLESKGYKLEIVCSVT